MTDLTPDIVTKIIALVRAGTQGRSAAEASGIERATFERWMELAEAGDPDCRDFKEKLDRAAAETRAAAEIELRKSRPASWLQGQNGYHAEEDLDAPGILQRLGNDFASKIDSDRRGAWRGLMRGIVTNLDKLVLARVTQPLRDVVSMVAEIDRNVLGGGEQANANEPLDEIAKRWTLQDEDDGGGSQASYKN